MKRKAAALMLIAGVVGSSQAGNFMSGYKNPSPEGASVGPRYAPTAANYMGPYGQPVVSIGGDDSSSGSTTPGEQFARSMLAKQYPPQLLQQAGYNPGMMPPGGPGMPGMQPGGMMPGGMPLAMPPGPVGAVAGVGMLTGQAAPNAVSRTQVRFVGPGGMKISWYSPRPDGKVGFTPQYLEAPARYNFLQSSIYRLKLSDIPNRAGVELYPTLEVVPSNSKTATFLAHSAVPIGFSEEDLEQVAAGNFVVKVVYLPDPQYQDLAATGPDEVVSSRLEPGVDPIIEARRRGSILAVVRLGNGDLEAPNTPAMDAPDPNAPRPGMMMPRPGMMPPGMMAPGMMPPGMTPPPVPGAGAPMGKAATKDSGVAPVGFTPKR